MSWSEADIPDQTGRIALVTGANSGIGWETARALAARGAHVLLVCRNRAKAEDALARLGPDAARAEIVDLDLGDLDGVRAAAEVVLASHDRLDLLINNAGLMATPYRRTAQGFEQQLGVNHLGHFALTGLLVERLLATPGSRIVNVASLAHRIGRIDFEDLQSERRYSPWPAYGQSKLANLLFTLELQKRLLGVGEERATTIAVAAHPGSTRSNLGHEAPPGILGRITDIGRPLFDRVLAQPTAMGALPTLRAATDPDVEGGSYWGPSGVGQLHGPPVTVGSTRAARDPVVAARLWAVSELLTEVRFTALP